GFVAFNEHLEHFMLRPAQVPTMLRHLVWRGKNLLRWLRKLEWRKIWLYSRAMLAGWVRPLCKPPLPNGRGSVSLDPGITVVIPSRPGRELLAPQPPATLAESPDQVVIVDNGSTDDTASWLAVNYPEIEVVHSPAPLSFARAVNQGIARARYSHVC